MDKIIAQNWVIFGVSVISAPIYVVVLVTLYRMGRDTSFKSKFYSLSILQGIYDLFAMLNFFIFNMFRGTYMYSFIFWPCRDSFIPVWCYAHIYFFLYLRIIGILTITLNRFFACVLPLSRIDTFITNVDVRFVCLVQLLVALFMSYPMVAHTATFSDPVTMNAKQDTLDLTRNTLMAASITMCAAVICAIVYLTIINKLLQQKKSLRATAMRYNSEIKAAIQLGALLVAFMLVVIHYTFMFIVTVFNLQNVDALVNFARSYYNIWSAILSYVSAYTMLLINRDIQKQIYNSNTPHPNSRIISITRLIGVHRMAEVA